MTTKNQGLDKSYYITKNREFFFVSAKDGGDENLKKVAIFPKFRQGILEKSTY